MPCSVGKGTTQSAPIFRNGKFNARLTLDAFSAQLCTDSETRGPGEQWPMGAGQHRLPFPLAKAIEFDLQEQGSFQE